MAQAPLDWRVSIVNPDGTPTASFQRLWDRHGVPSGSAVLWTGLLAEIPSGWTLSTITHYAGFPFIVKS